MEDDAVAVPFQGLDRATANPLSMAAVVVVGPRVLVGVEKRRLTPQPETH